MDIQQLPCSGTLLRCWWECKLVQPLWRTVQRFLKKLETELLYDTAIPLRDIQTKETKIERDTCTPMFIAALFTICSSFYYYSTKILLRFFFYKCHIVLFICGISEIIENMGNKTEIESETQRTNWCLPEEEGVRRCVKQGRDQEIQTSRYKISDGNGIYIQGIQSIIL